MDTTRYDEATDAASEKFDNILVKLRNAFASEIGDLDATPERERICLLEDMLHQARVATDAAFLDYASKMIESIDEDELIERKKANT